MHSDFELRVRSGEPASARNYLERYPELSRETTAVSELMVREAELVSQEEYFALPHQFGRFELQEKLGEGSFAVVYRAHDTELDRLVAVKIPRRSGQALSRDAASWLREARHAARLQHPGIVGVHEHGMIDGICYVISDYIAGTTLAEKLAGGASAPSEAAHTVARIADALDHAHRQGVIHRDVKPSNILLDLDGNPHLTDFGLAGRTTASASQSVDGKILGTPVYMSPEQAQSEIGLVDARTDVYSLGVVLYELLTGEVPFRGSLRMVRLQVVGEDPRPPRRCDEAIPRDLETICLKAMAKEPWRRYQTAAELAADLRRYVAGELVLARPTGRAGRLARWCRRRPAVATLAGAALLAIIGMASQWWRAEVNLHGAAREHARYRRALETASQITASILKISDAQEHGGSRRDSASIDLAVEQMNRQIRLLRDDPECQPALAMAYDHVGVLEVKVGRRAAAMEALKRSLAIWKELHRQRPREIYSLYYAAAVGCRLAEQFGDELAAEEKRRLVGEALDLYQKGSAIIRSRNPAMVTVRGAVDSQFRDLIRIARIAKYLQRKDEAIAWFSEALSAWNVIHRAGERLDAVARKDYVVINAELASLLQATGRAAEAIPAFLVVRKLYAEDMRADAENALARELLADISLKLGLAYRDSGEVQHALREFQESRTLWGRMTRSSSLTQLKSLSRINVEIGRIEDRAGRFALAIGSFTLARDLNEQIVAENPEDSSLREALAMCHHVIGNLHRDLGQFAEADGSFRRALQLRQALVDDFPDNARFADDLKGTRLKLTDAGHGAAGGRD